MPWSVALFLFLISPLYTMAVRDRLWPRLQDWYAIRSKRSLLQRIKKLEDELAAAEKTTPHTDVEAKMFFSLQLAVYGAFGAAYFLFGAILSCVWVLWIPLVRLVGIEHAIQLATGIVLFAVWNTYFGYKLHGEIGAYRHPRLMEYRQRLEKEIERLRSKLK